MSCTFLLSLPSQGEWIEIALRREDCGHLRAALQNIIFLHFALPLSSKALVKRAPNSIEFLYIARR